MVLDTQKREWVSEVSLPGVNVGSGLAFCDEEYVVFDRKVLIHWPSRIQLWTYADAAESYFSGSYGYFVAHTDQGGLLFPTKVPHNKATETMSRAQKSGDLFIVQPGAKITIDVSGVPRQFQDECEQGLAKAVEKIGCKVDPRGDVRLVASVTGPKQEAVSYQFSGSYVVQAYASKIAFVLGDREIWASHASNVPGFVSLQGDETMESHLEKVGRSPNISIFTNAALPEYLQKPRDPDQKGGAPTVNTLGASRITSTGIAD
jgi:hypothetical protein